MPLAPRNPPELKHRSNGDSISIPKTAFSKRYRVGSFGRRATPVMFDGTEAAACARAYGFAAPVKVVANLPYNVGTELLVRWLTPESWPPPWESLTLMFQREVAERIVAQPGGKAYGRLAVLAQWRATAKIAMGLPPEAFTPPPKVRSAVVHIEALPAPRFEADAETLSRVVKAAFAQRRKMLRAALKGLAPDIEDRLHAAGLTPTDRAEQVPIEGFCALAREIAKP